MEFEDCLSTAFQPVFGEAQNVIGYEALLRGPHSPAEMFAVAESGGYAANLDAKARKLAFEEAAKVIHPESPLWINVHPDSLTDPAAVLNSAPSDRKIVWEISERTRDDGAIRHFVNEAAARGQMWALDDVGDGWAGLARLASFVPDYIKMAAWWPRGLPSDRQRQRLFRAITEFARGCGIGVIAEGVEDQEQMRVLLDIGVDGMQGFFLADPVVAASRVPEWQKGA